LVGAYAKVAMPGAGTVAAQWAKALDIPALTNWQAVVGKQFCAEQFASLGFGRRLTDAMDRILKQQAAVLESVKMTTGYHDAARQLSQLFASQMAVMNATAVVDLTGAGALRSSLGRYAQVQATLGAVITAEHATLLRGMTRVSSRRYDAYLTGLPAKPIARRAAVAEFAGNTQSGLVMAESLTAAELTVDNRAELAGQFTTDVLESWQTGPARAREELFAALALIAPDMADWLKSAWEDIERNGYKAASKIANCTVECIDRTLRAIAPVDVVTAWIAEVGEKTGWMDKGRPTRQARVMFVMRHRASRDTKLVDAQVNSLIAQTQVLMNNLQEVKHDKAATMAVMRSYVLAAEGVLEQLLIHR